MGRVAAAGDNAAMESFFSLQKNVLIRGRWRTRNELRYEIVPRQAHPQSSFELAFTPQPTDAAHAA